MFNSESKFSSYLPAFSASALNSLTKNEIHPSGKTYQIYKEDGIFNYNKFLFSSGHILKSLPKLKDNLEIDLNSNLVLGDSGGFQIATEKLKYNDEVRKTIFNWLEYNTNYAMNLDLPPYVSSNNKKRGNNYFDNQLKQSVDNFKFFESNQSGATKFLNILHGRTKEDLEKWYSSVKDFNFSGGWSIGSVSVNIFYILQSFFYLYDMGEFDKINNRNTLIHILGFSKINKILFVSYLQKKLREYNYDINITFDSSTFAFTASFGNYYFDLVVEGTKRIVFSNTRNYDNIDEYFPCDCPICKNMKIKDILGNREEGKGFSSSQYAFISFHNLYRTLCYKEFLDRSLGLLDMSEIDNMIETGKEENNNEEENKRKDISFLDTKTLRIFQIIDKAFKLKGKSFDFIQNSYIEITSSFNKQKVLEITGSPRFKF